MSVTLCDEAIIRKIKYWVGDSKITILGVNESTDLFKYRLDENNDKPLSLPIISLSRDPNIKIDTTGKRPLSYDGLKIESSESKTNQLNAIPITITYNLDIYTRYEGEAQELVRNFIFNIVNYPKFAIELPYNNSKMVLNSYIYLQEDYQDNSDIPERLIRDQFQRKTLTFIVKTYLYDYRAYDNWRIDCGNIIVLLSEDEVATTQNSLDYIFKGESNGKNNN